MNNASKSHWEGVYAAKTHDSVSWFQTHAERSLALIRDVSTPTGAAIIDVGGGASTLVDDLMRAGYVDITVLDLAGAALSAAKVRLGDSANLIKWIEADIIKVQLSESAYDIWHDRAVFHFLTSPTDRRAYVEAARRAIKPGGSLIVSTFAEDGPMQCSGLQVVRYSVTMLHHEFDDYFHLIKHQNEEHHTPSGAHQKFVYCHFSKKSL